MTTASLLCRGMDAIVKKIQRWYFKFQVVTLIVEMDPAEKVGTCILT